MMLYPAVNELKEKTDSRYTLCILAAKRARDIVSGMPVLTDVDVERPVSIAVNEIYEDRITYTRSEKEPVQAATEEASEMEAAIDDVEAVSDEAEIESASDEVETEEADAAGEVAETCEAVTEDAEAGETAKEAAEAGETAAAEEVAEIPEETSEENDEPTETAE